MMTATAAINLCIIAFPKMVSITKEMHLLCHGGLVTDISHLQHNIVQVLFKCKISRQLGVLRLCSARRWCATRTMSVLRPLRGASSRYAETSTVRVLAQTLWILLRPPPPGVAWRSLASRGRRDSARTHAASIRSAPWCCTRRRLSHFRIERARCASKFAERTLWN